MSGWEERHKRWIELREECRSAKRAKNWERVAGTADAIVAYAARNADLSIVGWMFVKEKANALAKLERHQDAIAWYEQAAQLCEEYRRTERLRSPDDFKKDVEAMRKEAVALRKKFGAQG